MAFINIADARTLTEIGLAERTQQGWTINDAGRRHLEEEAAKTSAEPPTSVTPFTPKLV